ncbi:hypothetical protein JCM8547_008419 [Rhodosporidiobolus lusitaniae]
MTRPLPIGAKRIRPSKACECCRAVKQKCTGLDEEFLHALEDPDQLEAWEGQHPKCDRCTRLNQNCTFAQSRRKGRPRRLHPSQRPTSSRASSSRSGSGSDRDLFSSSSKGPVFFDPSLEDSFSTSSWPSPSSLKASPPAPALPVPQAIHFPLTNQFSTLARRYLLEAFTWAPILPPHEPELVEYLRLADPILPEALSAFLRLSPSPPVFPPAHTDIAPSTLLAGGLLVLEAFGAKDAARAGSILRWTCSQLQRFGWAGENSVFPSWVAPLDGELLVSLGWMCWSMEMQIGVMTGNRHRVLGSVQPPSSPGPSTLLMRAAALLRDATDYSTFWEGTETDRFNYTTWILRRSDSLQSEALEFLHSSPPRPSFSSTSYLPPTPSDLQLAAMHEIATMGALMSTAAVILLLSSASPLSPLVAPGLPCSLDVLSTPALPSRVAIRRAATQILDMVQQIYQPSHSSTSAFLPSGLVLKSEFPSPPVIHGPMWGCCVVVAAKGRMWDVGTAVDPAVAGEIAALDAAALRADLDLCEAVLRTQAERWPAAEKLAGEVTALKASAGFA